MEMQKCLLVLPGHVFPVTQLPLGDSVGQIPIPVSHPEVAVPDQCRFGSLRSGGAVCSKATRVLGFYQMFLIRLFSIQRARAGCAAHSGKPDQSLKPRREVGPAFTPRCGEASPLLGASQRQK